MNYRDRELTFYRFFLICQQDAFEETQEPDPEAKERILTVSKQTDDLGLTEVDITMFDNIESKEQQATAR